MATIVNELEAALASVTRLTAERDGFSAQLADAVKLVETLRAECATKDATHAEALKTVSTALDAEKAAHVATQADLEAKSKALANPAFAVAAVAGDKAAVAEGGSEAAHVKSKEDYRAELSGIKDPMQRSLYRLKYKNELGL